MEKAQGMVRSGVARRPPNDPLRWPDVRVIDRRNRKRLFRSFANVGIAGNACLKRMTPSPTPSDAAVIKAFAGTPGLLGQAPALIVRGRALDCECLSGPLDHPFISVIFR